METPNAADTLGLRTAFVNEWMWTDGPDPDDYTMPALLDLFDQSLGKAARIEHNFDAADQYDQAMEWLAERGYVVAHGVTRR